jgi:hypothetical protein
VKKMLFVSFEYLKTSLEVYKIGFEVFESVRHIGGEEDLVQLI